MANGGPSPWLCKWTLSFYQAKGGVRETTVIDGPCLTGGSTIKVVPESEAEELRQALRFYAAETGATAATLDAGQRARDALRNTTGSAYG